MKIEVIVGIIALAALEVTNMLTMQMDGMVMSGIVGAIVFVITRQYYKM
jgi:hypothetical protein